MLKQENITIEGLKKSIKNKGYRWFEDQINMIAIRTNEQIPDIFNDYLCMVYKVNGIETLFKAIVTTEPGVYYQKKLLNPKGCWVMMPNQMIDAFKLGYHQSKLDHRALRSVGRIYGQREDDKDGIILNDKDAEAFWIDGHLVGSNIHGADKKIITKKVGPWSAGCTVHESWSNKEEMCDIAEMYKDINKGLITYTLITENDYSL